MSAIPSPKVTTLKQLRIERFRGIQSLTWNPGPKVNVILGGGDTGKTTILDAIALLLNPTTNYALSDTDYWQRDVEKEFVIDAVVSLADFVPINEQRQMNWPWQWSGTEAVIALAEGAPSGEIVYRFRVRGTAEMDLSYEVVQPDDKFEPLPAALRRLIGLVRLSGDERNDRDLRLVQGSALDRMLDDKGFRARAGRALAGENVGEHLEVEAKKALGALETAFKDKALPFPLGLGITGGGGLSLNALIGLTAPKGPVVLPLISWGAGTRRLASLTIAGTLHDKSPITLVDELERGLECYRQRSLLRTLKEGTSQVFATTHSAAVLRAADGCDLWYLDSNGVIGPLAGTKVGRQLLKDPEAFLSRFTVVAEGATEVGFVSALLERTLKLPLADYGINVTDAGSNEGALDLLEALGKAGLRFGGMADNEDNNPGRWAKLKATLGDALCRWDKGCLEEEIFALVPDDRIEEFIKDADGENTGVRLRTIADRLDIAEKDFASVKAKAGEQFRLVIIDACCGAVPADKKADRGTRRQFEAHAQAWFKSVDGGRELAAKVDSLGLWPKLQDRILTFLNAIRQAVGEALVKGLHE
jgi:putative ATP-dependent endonuclease of OLD family